jgi:beta-aspartyl-peptidase (threonine type)
VHGGCGAAPSSPERADARHRGVVAATEAGLAVLRDGGTALDAVCAAVVVLEDDPAFNAGRGAVATSAGTYELDASVMSGIDRAAGAVAAISNVKNPVLAARAVLEDGRHVLFAGSVPFDLEPAPSGWFDVASDPSSAGTVGAVALDADGHVAAATSTGGRRDQLPGRVGDSPIIGAGTWADDRTCAVSGTGAGELFIRTGLAHSIHAAVAAGTDVNDAAIAALQDVAALGGTGGCIAVTTDGEVVVRYTTEAMARAWATVDGDVTAEVY